DPDFATRYMPEKYVQKLAQSSDLATINHLLPVLVARRRLNWAGKERDIVLIGTRGEVPILHRDPKKPLQPAVPPGKVVVAAPLLQKTTLKKGDNVSLLGRDYVIHDSRSVGESDQATIWMNLADAQKALGKEGLISAIWALECNCAADRM